MLNFSYFPHIQTPCPSNVPVSHICSFARVVSSASNVIHPYKEFTFRIQLRHQQLQEAFLIPGPRVSADTTLRLFLLSLTVFSCSIDMY